MRLHCSFQCFFFSRGMHQILFKHNKNSYNHLICIDGRQYYCCVLSCLGYMMLLNYFQYYLLTKQEMIVAVLKWHDSILANIFFNLCLYWSGLDSSFANRRLSFPVGKLSQNRKTTLQCSSEALADGAFAAYSILKYQLLRLQIRLVLIWNKF